MPDFRGHNVYRLILIISKYRLFRSATCTFEILKLIRIFRCALEFDTNESKKKRWWIVMINEPNEWSQIVCENSVPEIYIILCPRFGFVNIFFMSVRVIIIFNCLFHTFMLNDSWEFLYKEGGVRNMANIAKNNNFKKSRKVLVRLRTVPICYRYKKFCNNTLIWF